MINSTQNPQGTMVNQTVPPQTPGNISAVSINVPNPVVNVPPAYYYNYPQADGQPYYPPAQPQQMPPAQPQSGPQVPPPVPEAQPAQPAQPAEQQPANPGINLDQVYANLSSPDEDAKYKQLQDIIQTVEENERAALPYLQQATIDKLIEIVDTDTSQLPMPTERQDQLRPLVRQNDMVKEQAIKNGIDPNTVQLPNQISPEDEALARELTPFDKAERNKAYALIALASLQKVVIDGNEQNNGIVTPLTDLPGIAQVVNELKTNPNAGIRKASIDALRLIERPEYKNDLSTVFSIAQSDKDDTVATSAAEALAEVQQMPDVPQAQAQDAQAQPQNAQAQPQNAQPQQAAQA